MERWGKHRPIWVDEARQKKYNVLCEKLKVDVVVVGGGITGVVTAYKLQKAGAKVVLLTAGVLGDGATGHSTGHLTQILDKDFKDLISSFGLTTLQAVVRSINTCVNFIEKACQEEGIDCDFAKVPGFKFTETAKDISKLNDELKLARDLEIQAEELKLNPLFFPVSGMIKYKDQALFNPLKFTIQLADIFVKEGGQIFENTRVKQITDGEPCVVNSSFGSVSAQHVVLATHSPIGVYVSLHTRIAPYFSYVMGVRLKQPPPLGLYWDTETPYDYLRPYKIEGDIWIIGGRDHKTGQFPTTLERYIELENYVHEHFDVEEICFYWGDELYESVDGLPYIGKIPFTRSLFTGTGFAGTGLTFGTLSGMIISDLILGQKNEYTHIYDPSRVKPVASASSFLKENINVAKWMIGEFFDHHQIAELRSLSPEEGKIIDTEMGKLAVYKNEKGEFQALSSTCTHLGGTVHWNTAEKSWDCPCHGGRFRPSGEVFSGPPLEDLEKIPFYGEKNTDLKEPSLSLLEPIDNLSPI